LRIRLIKRPGNKFTLVAEQQVFKGLKKTTGDTVTRDGLRDATAKLIEQVRGQNPQETP
jgi:hypothetical protein